MIAMVMMMSIGLEPQLAEILGLLATRGRGLPSPREFVPRRSALLDHERSNEALHHATLTVHLDSVLDRGRDPQFVGAGLILATLGRGDVHVHVDHPGPGRRVHLC